MAYTPKGTYNDRGLSKADAARMAQYKQDWANAKARGDTVGMTKAHDGAENVRAGYGYSGGSDGSEKITTGMTSTTNTTSGTTSKSRNVSSQNINSAVTKANQALSGATGTYDTGKITNQQEALDMMKLGSSQWNDSSYDAVKNTLANSNAQIAAQWFPGATRDASGVWYYNGSPLYGQSFSGASGSGTTGLANTAAGSVARSADGQTYTISSDKGLDFLNNAAAGATMTGADGSTWTKNADGSTTIVKNGKTYTYGGTGGGYTPGLVDLYGAQAAQSLSGEKYAIGSEAGLDFLYNGEVGSSIVGGDGSVWVKNYDGGVNIYKNGQVYTIQGHAVGQPEAPELTAFEDTDQGKQMWSAWQDIYDRLNNYDSFSYDPNTDPLYLQYADSYTRGGQRAMTDVLGQLAARTGGMASSYAGSMAQQTYDQYMADLAGKIPELQQLAYSMYVDDYNRQVGDYERAYSQYADAYNRYNQDYLNQYNQYRDRRSDNQWNLENYQDRAQRALENRNSSEKWGYQKVQDALANQRYEDETAYSRQQNMQTYLMNNILVLTPTDEQLAAAGMTRAQWNAAQQQARRDMYMGY